MDNKFEQTVELLKEKLSSIKEILIVFLYGSVARGDYSLRHSDLDLFIVLKSKTINEKQKEKLNMEFLKWEYKYGVRIHAEYQGLNITYDDYSLVRKMIEEGQIIYSCGVFSFDNQLIGLKQYKIYDFSLKNSKNKTMFSKVLHGRKSWYYKRNEKIVKRYSGIIDNTFIIELGKGTLMVSKEKDQDLKNIFDNFGVEYELKKIVYA